MSDPERILYLPVRHHSPACAWHVDRVIRAVRPERVLVEGPRDATALVPFLLDPACRPPVAIYATYVERRDGALPTRHGAYFPVCDYSPELAALRAARDVGAEARFIDLTYPELVVAEGARPPERMRSLQDERPLRHSALLAALSRKVGARDHDDLWDCLYETGYRDLESDVFFEGVRTYCALARADYSPEQISGEAHDVREAAMAAEIAEGGGRTVVVTGGFHTVALPETEARHPSPVRLARPEDAGVTLMRYNFEQLDRLNGYASGMPSPEFYQALWEGRDVSELLIELGRRLRERQGAPSTADAIAALEHVRRLAAFRAHPVPTREDLLDGVRSLYVKGSADVEGVAVMAAARQLLAGDRTGEVPAGAGRPPLVLDFEARAAAHHIVLHAEGRREATLDLYRSAPHREASRFFRRLAVLGVPFAELARGPDFVAGRGLERIQEVWRYAWTPGTEARLIERSGFGATLEEAATALVLERFEEAERAGRRSDVGAGLLVEACRCGLHRHTGPLLARTLTLVGADAGFASVVGACEQLLLLGTSREPLEAHHLEGLEEGAERAWARAARLVASLAALGEAEELAALDALCAWRAAADALGDDAERQALRRERLQELADAPSANPVASGAACGLLFGDGAMAGPELGRRLAGHLAGGAGPELGARFLRGILRAARNACWQVPEVADAITGTLRDLEESRFISLLPHLRLAFADLTPRECDAVARAAAALLGGASIAPAVAPGVTEADVVRALRIDASVRARLAEEGLLDARA